jgi:3-dehydroquinate synthase
MNSSLIFLYGPSGSGKSTLGRLLAQNLGLSFFDLDAEIEQSSGMNIPQIFTSEGETGFRKREHAELQRLSALPEGVIALGGGALLDADSRARVEANGRVLLLDASADVLAARLRNDRNQRPLLASDTDRQLAKLLARRKEHYISFPAQLNTGALTPEQAAWQAQVQLGVFRVHTSPTSSYDVRVQCGGLDELGELLQQRGLKGPIVLVSDENVAPLYARRAMHALEQAGYETHLAIIPAGETHKTMNTVTSLWQAFLTAGVERSSTIVALGGGVTSDLAGFAAATYLRGVPWVAVPTSLLSMADASLGGKTGADLPQGKNLIGAFHAPRLVLADPQVLSSLPPAELRSGMGEVVKHGVISDPELFRLCPQALTEPAAMLEEIVRRAVAVKIRVIEADPYEQGWRAVLNLGHTIGHAVELVSGFKLRHGEAVSIGLVSETRLAEHIGLAQPGLSQQISIVLSSLGLPVEIPGDLDTDQILHAMGTDKKRAGGKVRFALPVKLGEARVGVEIENLRSIYEICFGLTRP